MGTGPGSAKRWLGKGGWQPRHPGGAEQTDPSGPALIVINPNSSEHVTDGIAAALAPLHGWGLPIR
ncbi:MAG: hypothetical protein AAGG09_18235, partial [Pseudomonadota bacterium]